MNGEPLDVPADSTVALLLQRLNKEPRYLAVERNFTLVPRTQHATCMLQPNDQIEIMTLVGGG